MYTSSVVHFAVASRDYDEIIFDENAYISTEKNRVKSLLSELEEYVGKPFPNILTKNLGFLQQTNSKDPFSYFFIKPTTRIFSLWFNINAVGWPGFGEKLSSNKELSWLLVRFG